MTNPTLSDPTSMTAAAHCYRCQTACFDQLRINAVMHGERYTMLCVEVFAGICHLVSAMFTHLGNININRS